MAYLNRRIIAVCLLGFSSGIPLALTGSTLQAWMVTRGVDLSVIGLFSLVGMPYALKFLWSPLVDRFVPPFLGRRRGWILITQAGLLVTIAAMALVDPAAMPGATAALAFTIAFLSASQDIASDAYRTEVLSKDEYGPGASIYILAYRAAMLVSGGLALMISDLLPWKTVYFIMAALMIPMMLVSVWAPEPKNQPKPPMNLRDAVIEPFIEFFKRSAALEILAFLLLYKIADVMALALTTPFMMGLGFSRTDIGAVNKVFGLLATLVGTAAGGVAMVKIGIERSLWVFGIAQGTSSLAYMLLAHVGHHYPTMVSAIAIENFCNGMGNAAYAAFLMSVCDRRFTATQYALFSSVMALTRVVAAAPTGFIVKNLGWEPFFLFCTFAMIPGLLLLTRYKRWFGEAVPA